MEGLLGDYTVRVVASGAALLGATSGALGSFAVLRRQSLLGDAISHAALPGIALAYLLTGLKSPAVLMIGAAAAGLLATWMLATVVRTSRIKEDTGLGMFLSVFFGIGMVLLTFIQKRPDASQAGLDSFLFGQASALLVRDVWFIGAVGVVVAVVLAVLWKAELVTFDRESARAAGMPVGVIEGALTALLVAAIVVGLQTVGVILMSALVVAPAAAARQWTDRLGFMVLLAGVIGAGSGAVGAVLSATTPRLPTGPTVVLVLGAVAVLSILLAPARGVVWGVVRRLRNRRRMVLGAVLSDLAQLARQHGSIERGHQEGVLVAMRAGRVGVARCLAELEQRGFVARLGNGAWALTSSGLAEAERREAQRS